MAMITNFCAARKIFTRKLFSEARISLNNNGENYLAVLLALGSIGEYIFSRSANALKGDAIIALRKPAASDNTDPETILPSPRDRITSQRYRRLRCEDMGCEVGVTRAALAHLASARLEVIHGAVRTRGARPPSEDFAGAGDRCFAQGAAGGERHAVDARRRPRFVVDKAQSIGCITRRNDISGNVLKAGLATSAVSTAALNPRCIPC